MEKGDTVSNCDISERSARGYCPGEDGHQAEIDGTAELSTTTTVEQPTELPHTGADPLFSVLGSITLLVGIMLVRLSGTEGES